MGSNQSELALSVGNENDKHYWQIILSILSIVGKRHTEERIDNNLNILMMSTKLVLALVATKVI